MVLEETLFVLGDVAPLARDGTAEAAAQGRIHLGSAPLRPSPRTRVFEAVPEFAFLAMPAQDLD
jgi:hypothetical protein